MMVCENGIYLQFKGTISLRKVVIYWSIIIFWVFCYLLLFFRINGEDRLSSRKYNLYCKICK